MIVFGTKRAFDFGRNNEVTFLRRENVSVEASTKKPLLSIDDKSIEILLRIAMEHQIYE